MRFSFQQPFVGGGGGGGVLRDATKNGCVGDYQCDYLFITQKAKFSENFPSTSKHNQPALGINNSPHKQFMKLLLSVKTTEKKQSIMHMFIL